MILKDKMASSLEIGRKIRQARDEMNLSQSDLGKKMENQRSHAAISDIERGKTKLGISELKEIAIILNKPLDFFSRF